MRAPQIIAANILKPFVPPQVEPVETTYIPAHGPQVYAGISQYLAVVAHPDEWNERDKDVRAAQVYFGRKYIDAAKSAKEKTERRRLLKPEFRKLIRSMPRQQMRNRLLIMWRRINQRLLAAEMANLQMVNALTFGPYVLRTPNGTVKPLHINFKVTKTRVKQDDGTLVRVPSDFSNPRRASEVISRVLKVGGGHAGNEQYGVWEPKHVHDRIWLASMPVLHLAMPLLPRHDEDFSLLKIILHPDPERWLGNALITAECMRAYLSSVFPQYDPAKAVRLLPAEVIDPESPAKNSP